MHRYLVLLIALAIALAGFGKGRAWSYMMMGTAYDKATKNVLRNAALFIGKQLVTTDSIGHYELTISGVTCDRGNSRAIDRCNEEAYGHLVVRRVLSTASVTIPSHWKSYALRDPGSTHGAVFTVLTSMYHDSADELDRLAVWRQACPLENSAHPSNNTLKPPMTSGGV